MSDPGEGVGAREPTTAIGGADAATVRAALEASDPLPGTAGFAGALDGRLLRDVLGRRPLFVERGLAHDDRGDPRDEGIDANEERGDGPADSGGTRRWAQDPTALTAPVRVPAGHVQAGAGFDRRWRLPDPAPMDDHERAVRRVREAVVESIDRVSDGTDGSRDGNLAGNLAVAFSGGVDSSLLAARLDAPLYVVGFPDSPDVRAARDAAATLGADLHVVTLSLETLEAAVPRVVAATARTSPMDVGIALPVLLVAEAAAADGVDRLVLGQGADELFGGYAKVADPTSDERVAADTVRGARREVLESLPDQFERDVLAVRAAGLEPVTPLVHDDVVTAALSLPGDLLVGDDGTRKLALRLAAKDLLPADLVHKEKRAMQYGSRVARELDRLARQAGFKRRMDDHVGQYVRDVASPPVEIASPGSLPISE